MPYIPSREAAKLLGLHPNTLRQYADEGKIKTIKTASGQRAAFMEELYPGAEVVTDIGGGLNFQRKGLVSLLERLHRGDKLRHVVAHKDRFARFGFDLIKWQVERNGGEVVVLGGNDHSPEQELTEDILAILHAFSCRLYGLRRYRNAIAEDTGLSVEGTSEDAEGLV